MTPTVIEALRLTNGRVRELMTRLRLMEGDGVLVKSQDFDDLRDELSSAAVWLPGLSPGSMLEADLAKELSDYRSSLEQLQQMLPLIQRRLITQKARLEIGHTHVRQAAAWARVSRSTF